MRYTVIDRITLINLSVVIGEKVSYSQNIVSNYNLAT